MTNVFHDCEFRFIGYDDELCCENKEGLDKSCNNCTENIHLNCSNYNPKKDMCLKWFETNISKNHLECREKTVFNDKQLSRKWSN